MSESVGEQLRKARLKQGLTIEEAAEATHIRSHYLQALETDDYKSMPSVAQGRGFLRLYANFLDLDARPLIEALGGVKEQSIPIETAAPEPLSPTIYSQTDATTRQITVEPLPASEAASYSKPGEKPAGEVVPSTERQPLPIWTDHFIKIGEKLRQQREFLGLTLDDIEHYTHIRERYLQALENGQLDDLPSPVQARGMLNNYARFLNLDSDEMLLRFADGLQARLAERKKLQEQSAPPVKISVPKTPTIKHFISGDMIFAGSFIILVIVLIFWGIFQIVRSQNRPEEQPTAPAIADVLLATPSISVEVTASIEPATTSRVALDPGLNPTPITPLATNADTAGILATGDATLIPNQNAPVQVYIIARQRTWMKVVADRKEVFNGRVITGNAYPFSATEQIEVVTGDGAALQVFYNQEDLGTLGLYGQVVNRIYTAEGVLNPTPTVTPTYTITPRPSATPVPSATPRNTQTPAPTATPRNTPTNQTTTGQ